MSSFEAPLSFNGVNGSTGRYAIDPMPLEQFRDIAVGPLIHREDTPAEKEHKGELKRRRARDKQTNYAPKAGVDLKNLKQTGWGVIFANNPDKASTQAIYEALSPLLKLREEQAGGNHKAGGRYCEYLGPDAYRQGETKQDFLMRHKVGPGPVDTDVIPYYLLIVGDPETIPFRFQYQLDVQFAVGRIYFDALEEYAAYAQSVVASEKGELALPRRAAIFATANNGDDATKLSLDQLAKPLAEWAEKPSTTKLPWVVQKYLGNEATKARLTRLLGDEAPAFLFTASHGMMYDSGDPRQFAQQGALLCQDWPGPEFEGPTPNSFFFGGDDVAADAKIFGTIAMHFACFGAGTPHYSDFSPPGQPPAMAPKSFLGRLPQKLIGHPRGGALAVIGHVERAWGCSFSWDDAGSQTEVFKSTIKYLMEGYPVGSALEFFNGRYAELSSDLSSQIEEVNNGRDVDPYLLSSLWTANNDARSYSVIGDPAVRLWLVEERKPESRPVLETITMPDIQVQAAAPEKPAPAAQPVAQSTDFAEPQQPASGQPGSARFNAAMVDYAWGDSAKAAASSLKDAAQTIGAWLAESFQTVTSVQVSTYVSDNIDDVTYDGGKFTGAKLRAMTIASLDGNTKVCVPEQQGTVDDALWKIHSDTFDKALANRVEMLKTAAAAIASLVPGGKLL